MLRQATTNSGGQRTGHNVGETGSGSVGSTSQPDEVAGTLIIGNDRLFLRTFPKLLNAKGLQMPQLTVHGLDVYYRDEGRGIPIVLGQASTGSGGQWRALSTQMADQYRLVAPDHIGYGRTAAFAGQMPLIGHEIAIIEALLEELAQPVHFVGHSYGGAILARTAVRVPEKVRSLTLYEPTLFHLLAPAGKLAEHDEIKSVRFGSFITSAQTTLKKPHVVSSIIGPAPVHTKRWMNDCATR